MVCTGEDAGAVVGAVVPNVGFEVDNVGATGAVAAVDGVAPKENVVVGVVPNMNPVVDAVVIGLFARKLNPVVVVVVVADATAPWVVCPNEKVGADCVVVVLNNILPSSKKM